MKGQDAAKENIAWEDRENILLIKLYLNWVGKGKEGEERVLS